MFFFQKKSRLFQHFKKYECIFNLKWYDNDNNLSAWECTQQINTFWLMNRCGVSNVLLHRTSLTWKAWPMRGSFYYYIHNVLKTWKPGDKCACVSNHQIKRRIQKRSHSCLRVRNAARGIVVKRRLWVRIWKTETRHVGSATGQDTWMLGKTCSKKELMTCSLATKIREWMYGKSFTMPSLWYVLDEFWSDLLMI